MARNEYDQSEIQSALDGLDDLAATLERKWGIGRLRLLVGDELRARFDRQATVLDKFLWDDAQPVAEVIAKIHAMRRGWSALDAAAAEAGAIPRPPAVMECPLPDGGVIAIVDDAHAGDLPPDGRCIAVYSAAEIGRMVAAAKSILKVKQELPGTVVEQIRVVRPWVRDRVGDLVL